MRGLAAVAWVATGSAMAGTAGVALLPRILSHAHAPEAVGGATFAAIDRRDGERRLVVTSLRTRGAEATAGLRVGDAVTAIDGRAVHSFADLRRAETPARPVTLAIDRGGAALAVTLLHPAAGGPK